MKAKTLKVLASFALLLGTTNVFAADEAPGLGRIRIGRPKNLSLPQNIAVTFDASIRRAGEEKPVHGRVSCIGGPEKMECQLPAGIALDLRIEAEGFAPSFRWGITSTSGGIQDLGPIPLLAGASIAGRIVDGNGEPLTADLEAFPSANRDPNSADPFANERLGLKTVKTRSDAKGYFQIVGITPGHVDLRAEASGFVPGVLAREIELSTGEAVVLPQTLVLLAPLKFTAVFLPEKDPWGHPWQVELMAPPGEGIDQQSGKASDEGSWTSAATPPGLYLLRVLDSQDQLWEMREVDLVATAEQLTVEIPVLDVRGRVSLAGEPFAGSLVLTRHASQAGIHFELDEGGKFQGFLPGEGRWLVSLKKEGDQARQASIVATEVRKAPGKSYAQIDLEIPNTRVTGDVVDSQGKKIANADVSYFSFQVKSMASVKTDAQGSFEIFGIEPGNVTLMAKKDELQSQGVIVNVEEEIEGERQRLVLLENLKIEGLAMHSGTPQASVRLLAWPEFGTSSTNSIFSQSSGIDGVFQFEIPGFVTNLIVLAEGRGGTRRLLRHPARSENRLLVEMDFDNGELNVDLSGWLAGKGPEALLDVSLVHDGIQLPQIMWRMLRISTESGSGIFQLGRFETGQYAICVGRRSAAGPQPVCKDGYLGSNGTLTLKTPSSSQGSSQPSM